jgi:hypothetical protein
MTDDKNRSRGHEVVDKLLGVYTGSRPLLFDSIHGRSGVAAGDAMTELVVFLKEDGPEKQAFISEMKRLGREVVAQQAAQTSPSADPAPRRSDSPHPPGPPRQPGPPTLIDAAGYVYEKPLGSEDYRPKTIGGFQQRDTTIGGFPAHQSTIGPPTQARSGISGHPINGPEGQPLYQRRTPGPFSGP